MGYYSESSEWADIVPIPQDDGGLNPLAAIAYPDEYSEATSYLRALMAKNEKSERALRLTLDIIGMNPSHYTVWLVLIPWRVGVSLCGGGTDNPIMGYHRLYRASVLLVLKMDILKELAWLNEVSLKHLKNYQIWYQFPLRLSLPPYPRSQSPFADLAFKAPSPNNGVPNCQPSTLRDPLFVFNVLP